MQALHLQTHSPYLTFSPRPLRSAGHGNARAAGEIQRELMPPPPSSPYPTRQLRVPSCPQETLMVAKECQCHRPTEVQSPGFTHLYPSLPALTVSELWTSLSVW